LNCVVTARFQVSPGTTELSFDATPRDLTPERSSTSGQPQTQEMALTEDLDVP
jgi:hypothetical protein